MLEIGSQLALVASSVAQWLLTLILIKGDICPGQRGRLHKSIYYLLPCWAVAGINCYWAFVIVASMIVFLILNNTGKTKHSNWLFLLIGIDILAGVIVLTQFVQHSNMSLPLLFAGLGSGLCLTQLLLVAAASRLQAFQRILPVSGIIAVILMLLCWLSVLVNKPVDFISIPTVLAAIGCILVSSGIWVYPLWRVTSPHRLSLIAVLMLLTGGNILMLSS